MRDDFQIAQAAPEDLGEISREVLGYLNFSSGASDPGFLGRLAKLHAWALAQAGQGQDRPKGRPTVTENATSTAEPPPTWSEVHALLSRRLDELQASPPEGKEAVYRDCDQARAVVRLTLQAFLPRYRAFHADLLAHLPDDELFNGFLVGRAFESILAQGGPWDEEERILEGALRRLNDYVGHRPVAVLDDSRRIEPYPHEWTRPLPLYVRGAGVAAGPHSQIVAAALRILAETDSSLCGTAHFSLERLDELSYDARAYDFDHPANKRLNYQFGQWDPHLIDNSGFYRRFVLTDVTLRTLNVAGAVDGEVDADRLMESAAVLACVILMASGVSGSGPNAHDSTVSLATLVPRIAGYRDEFYDKLLASVPEPHAEKLRTEAKKRKQPFGAIRQELNHRLARLRAEQQQQVFLARLYARMGFFDASERQSRAIHVAAARMQCEIDCHIAGGELALKQGDADKAHQHATAALEILHRGIDCGAIVDPWSILGFAGQYSLFPAMENTVRDHRVMQLTLTVEAIFGLWGRLEGVAAAIGNESLRDEIQRKLHDLATWWDKYASTEVSEVGGFSGSKTVQSAEHVASSLSAWHRAGAAAGDIAFWAERIEGFQSPKAYAMVVDALLRQHDLAASQSLLMHWLSRGESVVLQQGDYSFHALARRWMHMALSPTGDEGAADGASSCCARAVKFLEYLEANADEHARVPDFGWQSLDLQERTDDELEDHDLENGDLEDLDDDGDDLFAAAYEQVSFIDSTDDGIEGPIFDPHEDHETQFEWEEEAKRIGRRLAFFKTCADLWTLAAEHAGFASSAGCERLAGWRRQLSEQRSGLRRLLEELHGRVIKRPRCDADALIEYDHKLRVRESLLESTIDTCVSVVSALIRLASIKEESIGEDSIDEAPIDEAPIEEAEPTQEAEPRPDDTDQTSDEGEAAFPWELAAVTAWRAASAGKKTGAQARNRAAAAMACLFKKIEKEPLLYVPAVRGGNPWKIVNARSLQNQLIDLAKALPRWGLIRESCRLVEAARLMEVNHPQGQHAVSEFDRYFSTAFAALVEAVIRAARRKKRKPVTDEELLDTLNTLAEKLLGPWLSHSASLRLSVAEMYLEDRPWKELSKFIHNYGRELFIPRFFNEGNLRAILHQGIEEYLEEWIERNLEEEDRLVRDIADQTTSLQVAATWLQVIVQSILENTVEYKDYNYTTTQSDHGEQLDTFLDFLRLKAGYDRIKWNLSPLVIAHDVLVRHGEHEAAEMWTRGVAEQTLAAGDHYLKQYERLVRKHAMNLRTVRDLLDERFVRPLRVSRAQALMEPAIRELRDGKQDGVAAVALESTINDLAAAPTGVGLDLPDWLMDLANELEKVEDQLRETNEARTPDGDWAELTLLQLMKQLDEWTKEYETEGSEEPA